MNRNVTWIAASACLALFAASCSSSKESASASEGASTEQRDDYLFELPEQGDTFDRIDAMGVALTSTVLVNRDRTPAGRDTASQFQKDSPDVQNNPATLVSFVHFLHVLHAYWHDQLSSLGFEPCSDRVGPVVVATPCTLHKLRHDDGREASRVIDTVLPDYVSLDLDEPLGFPNGRTPWESISDKILAMGFLKMGGKCPGLKPFLNINGKTAISKITGARVPLLEDGTPMCTVETFVNMGLQVPQNDRPWKKDFPYLASPWWYSAPNGKSEYFWPLTSRLESPE